MMMMMIRAAVLSMLLGATSFVGVGAAPNGAGGCNGGTAAVGGPHLSQATVLTGTLSEGGLSLDVDGVVVAEGGTITVTDGVPSSFTVVGGDGSVPAVGATSPPPGNFRGFLIRAEVPADGMSDWVVDVTADPNAQEAAVCSSTATANIIGITHNSNVDKTSASGSSTLDGAAAGTAGTVDVTVVIENGSGVSVYYYSGYTLQVVAGGAPVAPIAPTEAPVIPPIPGTVPVDPTEAPVEPTEAPVEPPTDPPTSSASMVTASSTATAAAAVVAIAAHDGFWFVVCLLFRIQ